MNWKNVESPKFDPSAPRARSLAQGAYTLVEVMVAASLLGFMIVSLFAGFSSGFAVLRIARVNLRATQILEERMEVVRLINWKDLNTDGFIPTNFIAPFYPPDSTNASASGIAYTGTVTKISNPIPESYANNLCAIQINLTWTSGNITRSRQMTTYVSRY